jgi:hypothetical protein
VKFTRYRYGYNYDLFFLNSYVTYLTLYILVTSSCAASFNIKNLDILFLELIFCVLLCLCNYRALNDYFYIPEAVCLLHGTNCFLG